MANGPGDFNQDDLRGWAQGGQGGGEDDGDAHEGGGGGEGGEEGGGDPGQMLEHLADEIDEGLSKMSGVTLKDSEDKEFKKAWEDIEERAEELSKDIREACQARADLAEDEEEEDEEGDGEGDEEDEDEDEDEGDED